MSEVLRISNLRKSFGAAEVLKGIDLTINRGETVVILGASGSGKSTLLRCVNFLETPTSGEIHLEGKLIGARRPAADGSPHIVYRERELIRLRAHVGMVFQHFNLFPHMNVLDNVAIAPNKILGLSAEDAKK